MDHVLQDRGQSLAGEVGQRGALKFSVADPLTAKIVVIVNLVAADAVFDDGHKFRSGGVRSAPTSPQSSRHRVLVVIAEILPKVVIARAFDRGEIDRLSKRLRKPGKLPEAAQRHNDFDPIGQSLPFPIRISKSGVTGASET